MQRFPEQDLNLRPTDRKPKCLTRYTSAPLSDTYQLFSFQNILCFSIFSIYDLAGSETSTGLGFPHAILEPIPAFQQLSHVGLHHTTGICLKITSLPISQPTVIKHYRKLLAQPHTLLTDQLIIKQKDTTTHKIQQY